MGILAASAFAVRSMYYRAKGKRPRQLVFGQDMIIPTTHVENWGYLCQHKQAQIYKDVIFENSTRIDL